MRAVVAVAVLLCSCTLLQPDRPEFDYYVLTVPASGEPGAALDRPGPSLAIEDVSIPAYLDREELAIRAGDNRVVYSARARWAEPLHLGIERVLRQQLSRRLTPAGVSVSSDPVSATFLVAVDVQRFERHGNGVELWARWSLREGDEVVSARSERISEAVTSATAGAVTDAMSRAVGELASRVTAAVEQRPRRRRRR